MFRKLLTVFLIILIIALTVNLFRKDSDFSNSQSALSIQTQQNQTATKSSGVVEIVSPNYTNGSSSTNSISNPTIPITQPITSIDQNNTNNNRQNAGMCKSCSGYDENNKHYWGASYNGGACIAGESCAGSALVPSGDNTNTNKATIDPLVDAMINSSTTIRYGSRGDLVKGLQIFLVSQGYLLADSKIDGIYGRGTLSAVKNFQSANNLKADGIVGPGTKSLIDALNVATTINPATTGPAWLQYACNNNLGYPQGCPSVGASCCGGNGLGAWQTNGPLCPNGTSSGSVTNSGYCNIPQ